MLFALLALALGLALAGRNTLVLSALSSRVPIARPASLAISTFLLISFTFCHLSSSLWAFSCRRVRSDQASLTSRDLAHGGFDRTHSELRRRGVDDLGRLAAVAGASDGFHFFRARKAVNKSWTTLFDFSGLSAMISLAAPTTIQNAGCCKNSISVDGRRFASAEAGHRPGCQK